MSRNPYLAASRPTSSFTRSTRSSQLSKTRSHSNLAGLSSSSSSYKPSSSSYVPYKPSYTRATGYVPTSQRGERESRSREPASSSTTSSVHQRSSSTSALNRSLESESTNEPSNNEDTPDTSQHLKNYQQSKLQETQPTTTTATAITTRRAAIDPKSSRAHWDRSSPKEASFDETDTNLNKLSKSRSLDISQQQQSVDLSSTLNSSLSVDVLYRRAESMSEQELRHCYKKLLMENDFVKKTLKNTDDQVKERQQEWIRKERHMQRKISELEEECKQMEQLRQEIMRLKEENSSLIRVVGRLSLERA